MRSEKYIVSHGGFVGSEGPWFDRIILDVAWSHADINDDDLHHLTGLGPNGPYYFLDLSHNPGITDKSLKLIRELPLQWNAEINLQGTSVTVDGINKLKARFPRGKIEY